MEESLRQRLQWIGINADSYADPFDIWLRLRSVEGRRATLVDLYELAANQSGLAAHELPLARRNELIARALPVEFPGFEVTPNSTRAERDPIELMPYDPDWPRRYESWRQRLRDALGPVACRIEHVGSTAVPGLSAKPVIDIQVSVQNIEAESNYVPMIEALGVQLRNRDDEHRYFRPFSGLPREVQIHVCRARSNWEREHLVFRDYLRADRAARDAYTKAKQQAADHWWNDRLAYADAKSQVIIELVTEADHWARRTGWSIAS
jgi:GrpB-like predicted nucleotidyltransferase (UPF0157 family)